MGTKNLVERLVDLAIQYGEKTALDEDHPEQGFGYLLEVPSDQGSISVHYKEDGSAGSTSQHPNLVGKPMLEIITKEKTDSLERTKRCFELKIDGEWKGKVMYKSKIENGYDEGANPSLEGPSYGRGIKSSDFRTGLDNPRDQRNYSSLCRDVLHTVQLATLRW